MDVETLLQTLRDAGMDDAAISELLKGALDMLAGAENPEDAAPMDEEAKAGELLGVDF